MVGIARRCECTTTSPTPTDRRHDRRSMRAMCSPYPYPQRPGEADCRDFLRTGRCKYGDSCKYNHPPNVESGGGVRPLNPSEPLFPIRPGEPPCQYFLKHGTCKFGQSCKFNHPSPSSLADACGDQGALPAGQFVFVTSGATDAPPHLMSASSSVQVLPQRPTEPNCIYFLRNGKCKYGATCKFHHPLDMINRTNQAQHNMRQSHTTRDRSQLAGSAGYLCADGRGLPYANAANVTYVQPQRLQPIAKSVKPQQPTHILLPDGQIAVILDQQSLQNVNELNVQDRPKFYLSQTDGSIGTLPSIDQTNNPVVISPMLTATTNSTSNNTFDSSIDLMGTNVITYQGQAQGSQSGGPNKSGSGGSLSAYGSIDSGQGDYFCPPAPNQVNPQPVLSGLGRASCPEYAAWPASRDGLDPHRLSQAQARKMPPVKQPEGASENAAVYWPSGSFSSIPVTDRDVRDGGAYASTPNAGRYGSGYAVGQAVQRLHSADNQKPSEVSPSTSAERLKGKPERTQQSQESLGDDEGLTMMTSALLTMIDHNDSSPSDNEGSPHRSPSRNLLAAGPSNAKLNEEVYDREPILSRGMSPMRPPPGMNLPCIPDVKPAPFMSTDFNNQQKDFDRSRSPPGGGGYFIGGYDPSTSRTTPPWGG